MVVGGQTHGVQNDKGKTEMLIGELMMANTGCRMKG